jgi:hypothetical protein
MKQISYVLPIRKIGKTLVIPIPIKFAQYFKLAEDDLGVPCAIKMTKEELDEFGPDEVLGNSHLVIKIYKQKGNIPFSYLSGDISE